MADIALFKETGIQITLLLTLMVIIAGLIVVVLKFLSIYGKILKRKESAEVKKEIEHLSPEEIAAYEQREKQLNFTPPENDLSGTLPPADTKGVIQNINSVEELRVFPTKRRTSSFRKYISPELSQLILYFLGTAIFWLVLGTTFGLYAGIKLVAPDVEHTSWFSYGRLRPGHTNAVFWGWASLAMLGLAHYVILCLQNIRFNKQKGKESKE
ncbi:cbb3-type cytochrome c oxidase subunit I [Chryseobacterium bernardetii]|uniref:cbb3-type cytochrome c oxidase subunit I n=1 Tax=Chryseobacterium bernardetii TaxID=1241978 RepID=UPI000F4E0D42|nr:cbb3-type cytochrome c oxidase subunit I [Chryseobacterium bernardetii]AZB35828.1 hypothetical protein EG351_21080 [Chryseobacterium bernardetii]